MRQPVDDSKKDYVQTVDGLEADANYDVKHEIVDDVSGMLVEAVPASPIGKTHPFETPKQNTVRVDKESDMLTAEWHLDNVHQDDNPSTLLVHS